MDKQKSSKQNNGRLSLHPMKFEDAVKGMLEAKPEKNNGKSNG